MNADSVASAVQKLGSPLVLARRYAADALGILGDPRAIGHLVHVLEDEDVEVCLKAAKALKALGSDIGIMHLNRCLKDADRMPRALAAIAAILGEIGNKQSVNALLKALNNESENVRKNAATALGALGDLRAVTPLIDILNNQHWCFAVAKALGQLGDKRAVLPLIAALDYGEWIRTAATEALGYLGDEQAIPPLIKRLKDPYWRVRKAAVESLMRIARADPQVVQALQERVSDKEPDSSIRIAAVSAIRHLTAMAIRSTRVNNELCH